MDRNSKQMRRNKNLHTTSEYIVSAVRRVDSLIDNVVIIILFIWLAFGIFAIWDNYNVLNKASTDRIYTYKPEVGEDGKLVFPEAFNELVKINDDVVAWITVEGTNIDLPIVQYSDNHTYLNKDFFGQYSMAGCPFLDKTCSADFSDDYSIVYGHHLEGGRMFGDLDKFMDQEFLMAHHKGMLHLRRGVSIEVAFVCTCFCDAYEDEVIFTASKSQPDKSGFMKLLEEKVKATTVAKADSLDINESAKDSYVALSTCADDGSSKRVVLIARLEEGG